MIISGNDDLMVAYGQYTRSGTELTLTSSLIKLLHHESTPPSNSDASESDDKASQGSRRTKRAGISIVIPKRNIQKLPAGMERL